MSARDTRIFGADSAPDPGPGSAPLRAEDVDGLLAAAARGDATAFNLVCIRLTGPVYAMALSLTRDPHHAEEVAQEVFLEMWRTASRYDPARASAITWALTIARRRAIDRIRAMTARRARERENGLAAQASEQVIDTVEQTLDRQQLLRCLRRLSYPQMQAIVLAFYGGHTYAEVASLLGVPLGTVKTRIRDGLARLRAWMQAG